MTNDVHPGNLGMPVQRLSLLSFWRHKITANELTVLTFYLSPNAICAISNTLKPLVISRRFALMLTSVRTLLAVQLLKQSKSVLGDCCHWVLQARELSPTWDLKEPKRCGSVCEVLPVGDEGLNLDPQHAE